MSYVHRTQTVDDAHALRATANRTQEHTALTTRPSRPPKTAVTVLSRQGVRSLTADYAARLSDLADVTFHVLDRPPCHADAAMLLRDTEILAATNLCLPALDAGLLDAMPNLRAVVLYATGYDHIDVDLLAARNVGLSVLPDYATTPSPSTPSRWCSPWRAGCISRMTAAAVWWPPARRFGHRTRRPDHGRAGRRPYRHASPSSARRWVCASSAPTSTGWPSGAHNVGGSPWSTSASC